MWIAYCLFTKLFPSIFSPVVYCFSVVIYLPISDYIYGKQTLVYLYKNYTAACMDSLSDRYLVIAPNNEVDVIENLSLKTILKSMRKGNFDIPNPMLNRIYRNSVIYASIFRVFVMLSLIPSLIAVIWG